MSKIEEYKQIKDQFISFKDNIKCCLGRDQEDNDKHLAEITFVRMNDGDWQDIEFNFHAVYGYYGCSSAYSATSKTMGKYLAKAINKNIKYLLDDAVKLAEKDVEEKRQDAEDEARSVLKQTKKE